MRGGERYFRTTTSAIRRASSSFSCLSFTPSWRVDDETFGDAVDEESDIALPPEVPSDEPESTVHSVHSDRAWRGRFALIVDHHLLNVTRPGSV